MNEELKIIITAETKQAQQQTEAVTKEIEKYQLANKAAAATAALLSATVIAQSATLVNLTAQHAAVAAAEGADSIAAVKLARDIKKLTKEYNANKSALANAEQEVERTTSAIQQLSNSSGEAANATNDNSDSLQDITKIYSRFKDGIGKAKGELEKLQEEQRNLILLGQQESEEYTEVTEKIKLYNKFIGVQTSVVNKAEAASNNRVAAALEEVKAAATITDKIQAQVQALALLKESYINTASAQGLTSDAAMNCGKEIEKLSKELKESYKDWQLAADGADIFDESLRSDEPENFTDKVERQAKELNDLKKRYTNIVAEQGKHSDAAKKCAKEIEELSEELNKNQKALDKASKKADKLDESYENAEKGGSKFLSAMKGIGKGVGVAFSAVGAAVAAVGGALIGVAAGTKEYQEAQAKLNTAFEVAGMSAQTAQDTYMSLYRVLGDDQQAVEAANHLAKLTNNQAELEQWTKITQGVYATFGDSLPIESLTEAANETAKTGELTGALSDALLWAGINEDDFKASLLACNDEAEREQLIRETLLGLYSASADSYEKNAAAILAENEAQAKLTDALATMGEVALPIMTMLKEVTADALIALAPFVEMMANGLQEVMKGNAEGSKMLADGLAGAIDKLLAFVKDTLPGFIDIAGDIFESVLAVILEQAPSILQAVIEGLVQLIDRVSEMLPELVPIFLDAILLCVETIVDNLDLLLESGMNLVLSLAEGLILALPDLIEKIPVIITKLVNSLTSQSSKMNKSGGELLGKLIAGILAAIPSLIKAVPQIITALYNGLKAGIKNMMSLGRDLITGIWSGISDKVGWITDKIKSFGKDVIKSIKGIFGIASPSKVMKSLIGKNLALGIGEGFVNTMTDVNKDIIKSMEPLTQARSFDIVGEVDVPQSLNTARTPMKPINTENTSVDKLAGAITSQKGRIVLKIDKKVLGEATVEGINDITKLTGEIPLLIA